LVASSSEVYGAPLPGDLPLVESHPRLSTSTYGRSKIGQEDVALAFAHRRTVIVTRAFNHIGPGQRPVFVAPALAARVLEFKAGGTSSIAVGNLDVKRDIGDVRDVVRAYRLLAEAAVGGRTAAEGPIYNVATGSAVSIRTLLATLCELSGVPMVERIDPRLVREGEPAEIRGDATKLRALTGWVPRIELRTSLADLLTGA
jgi:GDP-4-dehydro-6-deoxy-D-mannose reductase